MKKTLAVYDGLDAAIAQAYMRMATSPAQVQQAQSTARKLVDVYGPFADEGAEMIGARMRVFYDAIGEEPEVRTWRALATPVELIPDPIDPNGPMGPKWEIVQVYPATGVSWRRVGLFAGLLLAAVLVGGAILRQHSHGRGHGKAVQ